MLHNSKLLILAVMSEIAGMAGYLHSTGEADTRKLLTQ